MWRYEVYNRNTHELMFSDTGFSSESEAEYYARMEADARKAYNYYIRTIPVTDVTTDK